MLQITPQILTKSVSLSSLLLKFWPQITATDCIHLEIHGMTTNPPTCPTLRRSNRYKWILKVCKAIIIISINLNRLKWIQNTPLNKNWIIQSWNKWNWWVAIYFISCRILSKKKPWGEKQLFKYKKRIKIIVWIILELNLCLCKHLQKIYRRHNKLTIMNK